MNKDKRYEIRPGIVYGEVCGTPILVSAGDVFAAEGMEACLLNETGAFVWKLADEGLTEEEIIRRTGECYDAEPDDVKASVQDFLRQMEEQGHLRTTEL